MIIWYPPGTFMPYNGYIEYFSTFDSEGRSVEPTGAHKVVGVSYHQGGILAIWEKM